MRERERETERDRERQRERETETETDRDRDRERHRDRERESPSSLQTELTQNQYFSSAPFIQAHHLHNTVSTDRAASKGQRSGSTFNQSQLLVHVHGRELLHTGHGLVKLVPLAQGLGQLAVHLLYLTPQAGQQNSLITQPWTSKYITAFCFVTPSQLYESYQDRHPGQASI